MFGNFSFLAVLNKRLKFILDFILLLVNKYKRVLQSILLLAKRAGIVEPIGVIAFESIKALYSETTA